ncbi:mucin-5AC-like [Mizuhopecten yessoensis]|uniref:mucin-5AC-like n=1 Tax=Mizuhopecten yessoensis TaxID=6573 RepID=UPI000B45C820|nr:mucin-5AC-like [Mizuhopecten yessoensis]
MSSNKAVGGHQSNGNQARTGDHQLLKPNGHSTTTGKTSQQNQGTVSFGVAKVVPSTTQHRQVVGSQFSNQLRNSPQSAAVPRTNQKTIHQSSQNNNVASVPVDQTAGSSQHPSFDPSQASSFASPNSKILLSGSSVQNVNHWSGSPQGNILGSQDLINIHQNSPIGWVSPIVSNRNSNRPKHQSNAIGQQQITQHGMASVHSSGASTEQITNAAQPNNHLSSGKSAMSSLVSSNAIGTNNPAQTHIIQTSQSGQSKAGPGSQASTSPGQHPTTSQNHHLQQARSHTLALNQHRSQVSASQAGIIPPVPKTLIAADRPGTVHQTSNTIPLSASTSTQPGRVTAQTSGVVKSVTTGTSNTAVHSRSASEVSRGIQKSGRKLQQQGISSPSTASHHNQRNNPRRVTQTRTIQHGPHHKMHSIQTGTSPQRQRNNPVSSTNLGTFQQGHHSNHVTSTKTGKSQNSQQDSPVASTQTGTPQNGPHNSAATSTKIGASQNGPQNNRVISTQTVTSQNSPKNNPVVSAQLGIHKQGQQSTGTSSNGLHNSHVASPPQITTSQNNQQNGPVASTLILHIATSKTQTSQNDPQNIRKTSTQMGTSQNSQRNRHVASSQTQTSPNGHHTSHIASTSIGTSQHGKPNSPAFSNQIGTSNQGQRSTHIASTQIGKSQNGPQNSPVASNQIGTPQSGQINRPVVSTQTVSSSHGQQNSHVTSAQTRPSHPGHQNIHSASANTGTVPNINTRNTPVVNNNHGSSQQGSSPPAGHVGTQQNSIPTNNQQTERRGTSVSGFNQLSPISHHQDVTSTSFAFLPPGTASGQITSGSASRPTTQKYVSTMKASTTANQAPNSFSQRSSKEQGPINQTTPTTSLLFNHPVNTNAEVTRATTETIPGVLNTIASKISVASVLTKSPARKTKVAATAQATAKPAVDTAAGITNPVISSASASQNPAVTTAPSGTNQTVASSPSKTISLVVKASASTNRTFATTAVKSSPAVPSVPSSTNQSVASTNIRTHRVVLPAPGNTNPQVESASASSASTNAISFNAPAMAKNPASANPAVGKAPSSIHQEMPAVSSVQASPNPQPASATATKPVPVMAPTSSKPTMSMVPLGKNPALAPGLGRKIQAVGKLLASANQRVRSALAGVTASASSNPAVSSTQTKTNPVAASGFTGTSRPDAMTKANSNLLVTSASASTIPAVPSPPPNSAVHNCRSGEISSKYYSSSCKRCIKQYISGD